MNDTHASAWTPLLLMFALGAAGTSGAQEAAPSPRDVASPAGERSALPNLHAAADGTVLLSWVEPGVEHEHALRFARWSGSNWTDPRTIVESDAWFVNWADFPSLVAVGEDALAAHVLVRHPEGTSPYAYDVQILQSADGASFEQTTTPHTDGTPTEHGFASLVPTPDARVLAVWLDGRETFDPSGGGGHDAGHGSGRGAMTLRTAVLDAAGGRSEEALLDDRICDCCQTSAARTASGYVVAYRDRSDDEIRDISIVRHTDGAWSEPTSLHDDGWVIPGCPVDGPSIVAEGDRVAVSWFTSANDEPRVQVAFSSDGGATFGEPVVVDDGLPLGRTDVVFWSDGTAAVSWIERIEGGAEVRLRNIAFDDAGGAAEVAPAIAVAPIWPTRASGFPRMVRARSERGELVLAWTDASQPSRVRTAILER